MGGILLRDDYINVFTKLHEPCELMSGFISVSRVIDTVIYRHKYFSLITFTLKPRIASVH